MKLSLVVPCFGRPQRTLRAMQCVLEQDMDGWEAFFIGDGCPEFQKMMDEGVFDLFEDNAEIKGNRFVLENLSENKGGWGYAARNHAISRLKGDYTLFMDNDDVILRGHFSNYYNAIRNAECDMVYFDSYIEPIDAIRETELKFGSIGHSEIIVRTNLLLNFSQKPEYGHDWELIKHIIDSGALMQKSNNPPTYIVKEIGGGENRERLYEKGIN